MNGKPNTNNNGLKVDFSHRLSSLHKPGEEFTLSDLAGTISLTCGRATSMLNIIALQFDGGATKLNDEINQLSLMAVENEIDDIKSLVMAFWGKSKGSSSQVQKQEQQ